MPAIEPHIIEITSSKLMSELSDISGSHGSEFEVESLLGSCVI
jgi:hypothetical protein